MALSQPFLVSTNLFSSISSDYEKKLKENLWRMHKYMDLSMDELYRMTVADRMLYITLHNKLMEEEKERNKVG